VRKDFWGAEEGSVIAEMSTHPLCKRYHYVLSVNRIHTRVFLKCEPNPWCLYTRFAWAGGTCPRFAWAGRIFSPVILLCQFLVLAGNRFWFYILLFMYLGYRIVPYSCSVVLDFLVLAGNSFWCYVRT
jgi:hypothetical protein